MAANPPTYENRVYAAITVIKRILRDPLGLEQLHPPLSDDDKEIMRLAARGYTTRQIAAELGYAQGTVGDHIATIVRRLGLRKAALPDHVFKRIEAAIAYIDR